MVLIHSKTEVQNSSFLFRAENAGVLHSVQHQLVSVQTSALDTNTHGL